MAVPTITSVTPATGAAGGGELVTIIGTNFREYIAPAYGYLSSSYQPNVKVTFNGVEAPNVYSIDATELIVEIPTYTGDLDLNIYPLIHIVVTNLDDNGNVIVGESVTFPSSFRYVRESLRPPTLTVVSPIQRITKAVLRIFKRELLLETNIFTHTEYSADGITLAQASVPTFTLIGPDISQDDYGEDNEEVDIYNNDGTGWVVPPPVMHTMSFDYVCACNSRMELLTFMGAVRKIIRRNCKIVMAGDIPANSTLKLPVYNISDPSTSASMAKDNLHSFAGSFELRRVPILYLPASFPTYAISTMELQVQLPTGTLVEVVELQ